MRQDFTIVNGVWRIGEVNVLLGSSTNATLREGVRSPRHARIRRRSVHCHVAARSPNRIIVTRTAINARRPIANGYTNHSGYPVATAPMTLKGFNAEIFAPVPLSSKVSQDPSSIQCLAYQESLQKELGSFISSQIPEKSTPSSVQFLSASVHHACVFSANQSGKA